MSKNLEKAVVSSVLCVVLLSCAGFAACFHQEDEAVKQLVQDFWSLALDNKIDEANKLTAFKIKIKEDPPMTEVARVDGVNDCCLQEFIFDEQLKIEKISDTQVYREKVGQEVVRVGADGKEIRYLIAPTVGMKLETLDKKGKKTNLAVCLGKTVVDDTWKIKNISFIEGQEKLKDKCLPSLAVNNPSL